MAGAAVLAILLAAAASCAPDLRAPPAPSPPAPQAPEPPVPAAEPLLDGYGRMTVEAMEYPWSALGRLNTGGRGYCTGVLVGPDVVLTTARCLYNAAEGRWWRAPELHFVAGYQRDAHLIHAPATSYETAPGYAGGAGATLGNAASNWALLRLAEPIGQRAGWLAVHPAEAVLESGHLPVRAGYRQGWGHALTLKLPCPPAAVARGAPACRDGPGDAALPSFAFVDGALRVVGLPDAFGGAELPRAGAPPSTAGGPAAPLPRDTVTRLLRHLGYLKGPAQPDPEALAAAIRRSEQAAGLPVAGRPSVALLGALLAALQQELVPPGPVSQAPTALGVPIWVKLDLFD